MKFYKYHALGNAYLIFPNRPPLTSTEISTICNPNYGLAADGILFWPNESERDNFSLRIFNPDGSEAEKSGNGLRIFARFLWDVGAVGTKSFEILTLGGRVRAKVEENGRMIQVEMGRISFDSYTIPVAGPQREVINEEIELEGETFKFSAASIGNPHCVVLFEKAEPYLAKKWGPPLEQHPLFPNRTNVQFLEIIDRDNIKIEIWERGAGYTLASGSSSCAAAAVAHRLDLCNQNVHVHMPGGVLQIKLNPNYEISMRGPVTKICDGKLARESLLSD